MTIEEENKIKIEARPWTPQDLLDDLQGIIDEEPDRYLNTRRTTICMALDYLKEYFDTGLTPDEITAMEIIVLERKMADIESVNGVPIERVIQLVEAEKEKGANDPLNLEDLREMDGEPVWVERPGYGKRWALVQVWAKSTNVIYFTYNNGSTSLVQVELDCGGKAYRRKPEEGTT